MEKMIRRADLLLAGGVLLAALCCFLGTRLFRAPGAQVTVKVDGEVYAVYPLGEDGVYAIRSEGGTNEITVSGGTVTMTDSDCPRELCQKHTPISKSGEVIVCLPHRVTVEITGGEAASVDAITG